MKLDLGAMRHRLVHQRPVQGDADGFGEPARTHATLGTVLAEIRPLNAREQAIAQQMVPIANTFLRFQWVRDVQAKDRFVFGSRVFEVVNATNTLEINREVRCFAAELIN